MHPLKLLKHFFIPHEHNDYKPHLFREVSVVLILLASIFMLGFSAGSSFFMHKTVLGASVAASVLVDLANESRIAYNEVPLQRNTLLDTAAQMKAEDMIKNDYFAHESPSGVTPWHWFKEAGYVFVYAGENLAINFNDSKDVNQAWLDSPKHRANLLNINFREIGIATAEGIHEGAPTIFVVQMFGTPATAASNISTSAQQTSPTQDLVPSQVTATGTPEVKGETEVVATSTLKPIVSTPLFTVVKNSETQEIVATTSEPIVYTSWYDRLLFKGSHVVDIFYKALIIFLAFGLALMVFIEIRKQHWKHIMYGVGLLVALVLFVLINQKFF
ncbi:MAG: CAP domain-containing protein [Polynucleobacter sp.]|nr:MAG: CAP domain-containing protein [Polynucleobacter sp.]